MAYNLGELISDVHKRAKDTSLDTDMLTDFIQETQNQVLGRSRFPFMEESDTDTLTLGSNDLILDNEIDVILSLHLTDVNDNPWTPQYVGYADFFERYDPETSQAAHPTWYTIYGNTLVFQAPADANYGVSLRYLRTPSVLSLDTDEPDIPERYKELLIRGAMARVEEYRGNYDIAALHERKVEELTEDMLTRSNFRQLAQPHKARFGRR